MSWEELSAAYIAAGQWLDFLIDHPDTTVSVEEYRMILHDAQQARNTAHDALLRGAPWASH